jgi:hypothetical protein
LASVTRSTGIVFQKIMTSFAVLASIDIIASLTGWIAGQTD